MIIIHGIGALLIDWLRDVNLLEISVVKSLKENKANISIVIPTKILQNISRLINPTVLPNKIPMIVKPKEYKREQLEGGKVREEFGGYLLNGEYYSNEIIIKNWRSKEISEIEDLNSIYKTINNVSSVAYKINQNVLDFIRLYDSKLGLTTLNTNHPLENKSKLMGDNGKSKLLKWEKI